MQILRDLSWRRDDEKNGIVSNKKTTFPLARTFYISPDEKEFTPQYYRRKKPVVIQKTNPDKNL